MSVLVRYLFLAPVLSLVSCSSMNVRDEMIRDGFSFADYHTFDFRNVAVDADSGVTISDEVAEFREAVKKQMLFRGITQDKSSPELKIDVAGKVVKKVQTRQKNFVSDPPTYIGQRRYSWKADTVAVGQYLQGSFMIQLIENRTGKPVWSGVVEGVLPDSKRKRERVIHQSVRELFQKK